MEKSRNEALKMALLKIFGNESVSEASKNLIAGFENIRENVPLEELPTDEIISLVITFLTAYPENKQALIEYVDFLQKINIFELRHEEADSLSSYPSPLTSEFKIHSAQTDDFKIENYPYASNNLDLNVYDRKPIPNIEADQKTAARCLISEDHTFKFDPEKASRNILDNVYDRSDRIYLISKVKDFKFDFIDWEDRSFLIEMIKYTFYKSLLALRTIVNEENIKQKPSAVGGEDKKMESYSIHPCGHIDKIYEEGRGLLTRRLKPTMTMDELTSIAISDMKERDKKSRMAEISRTSQEEDDGSRSRDEHERIDSAKEDARSFPGNTKNIG